jgi:ribosomal protein S18 acetylase RimI-like enzyme
MLTWAESKARERIALAPEGTRVIMKQGTSSLDHNRNQALERYGFDLVRHFYRMQIELNQPPQAPSLPDGFRILPIDIESELEQAILAMDEGFQDHWGHVSQPPEEMLEQWKHFLDNDKDFDPSLWFLAKDGNQIAGICRCSGETVEDPEMGWVNQLCVRPSWRRRGLGMALLLTAFNVFYARGKARAALAVDASSLTNATQLYEKAGMHVTRQYETYEKELRPGEEIATQSV